MRPSLFLLSVATGIRIMYCENDCLRDYQQEMKLRLFEEWELHRSVMVQMPTGTGKTHLLAAIVREFLCGSGSRVWIVAHRRELVEQIEDTVSRYGMGKEDGRVKVMSIQWLSRHRREMEVSPGLIVIDEGTGKSTFIKILMGQVQPDSGTVDIGETVRFGYYSQDGLQFDEQMKVIDVVQDIAEVIELGNGKKLTASQFLQHFLFTPETQHSYVYKLSGGERRRLYLCTVLMRNPNFLVLDEPTNDLDIITLNVLEEYLQNFKGCVIVVSHDRYFMDKVVDHLMVFNGQGDIRDFPGNYSDYRDWKDAKAQQEKEAEKPQEEKTARVRLNDKRKMSFKEKREFEQLEKEIAELETEKAQIEEQLCSGTLSVDELTEKSKRLPEVNDLIDEKTMRWLELSEIEG